MLYMIYFQVQPSIFLPKQKENSSKHHKGTDMAISNYLQHACRFTLTFCSPFSKRDNISESLLSECTLLTVQQRCCNRPIMYSFSICSCILNSLKVAHSDWRNDRKSLLFEKLVFDSWKKEWKCLGRCFFQISNIHLSKSCVLLFSYTFFQHNVSSYATLHFQWWYSSSIAYGSISYVRNHLLMSFNKIIKAKVT